MKLNKKLSLLLVPILFVSACNAIQQPNPAIKESPTDCACSNSRDGIVYEKPVWMTEKGESGGFSSLDMEVNVKNNNNKPAKVVFHFELWSSHDNSGNVLATCSTSGDTASIWTGSNDIVSSNGTAKLRCSDVRPIPIKEAGSYSLRHGMIVIPLDENRPDDVEVLETGFEKTEEDIRVVTYTVYAKIQSKSDQDVVTRFYVLDNQGVQFISCDTDNEIEAKTTIRVECDVAYNTTKINQSPASVIVDVITLDSWEKPVE